MVNKEIDRTKYTVVYMPTALGFVAFGWMPNVYASGLGKEEAEMECYLASADESTPDKNDFSSYVIVPPAEKVDET